ncbi:hypothetical protein SPHINGO8BC_140066 [Sphingobacterium multivorum]|uniref:Uncharacterized protein n=1 Tax=Sphingobacterium multivorum TaxID=28454 RepID=A0A653Z796_SPHMU|nr:hypothetical protein SPHINGO8BC_140066 [Sphingobacterium multivorum]
MCYNLEKSAEDVTQLEVRNSITHYGSGTVRRVKSMAFF